ncbi:MAG: carboxypeptidase-like regulatory domain-containing protein [Gammaproteobacteria bacterium]|nr:carboxypeptidase-like regulatory domain-containing protein [Gammaproteobacteria bacterium]
MIFSCLVAVALPLCGEETSTIEGRIVSDHADAELIWLGVFVGSVEQEIEAWSWTSVAATQFSLEIPDAEDDITLVALRKNFVPITTLLTPEVRASEITLEFESGQVLSGLVLSTDGIAVPDALLKVRRLDGSSIQIPSEAELEWTTNEDGTFSIGGLVESSYDVHVELTHAPKESFVIRIKDGEENHQDLVLTDAYHVKGRVVDHAGEGVVGATVNSFLDPILWKDPSGNVVLGAEMSEAIRIHGSVWGHLSNDPRTTSDSTGAFQMGPFVYGQGLEMSASHKDGGSTSEIKVFSGNHEISLILSKTVDVFGTVVDAETGAPIEQFTLEVRGRANSEFPHSESGGRVSAQVDSAAWAIVIQAPNYIPYFKMDLNLDSLDVFDLGVVELNRGVHVTGQVYDLQSREPVNWALIESWGRVLEEGSPPNRYSFIARYMSGRTSTRSDSEGKFSIGPLPADESILYVEAHSYQSEEIVVDRPAEKLDIGLKAVDFQNTKIVARIRTANGEPVEGRVEISQGEETSFRPYARFPGDDHSWNIWVYPGNYKVWAVSDRGRSKVIDVVATDGITQEVVLIVDPFGRLRGNISGLKSGEDPFVWVFSGNNLVQTTGVVLNGEFELEGIGVGSFTVRIETSMNRRMERSFELSKAVGEAFVEIAFEGDSRLYGRVLSSVDRNSKILAIGKKKGSISGWGDLFDDGSFEIRGLSDGEYWIEIEAEREIGISSSNGESEPVRYEAVVVGDTELTINLASP